MYRIVVATLLAAGSVLLLGADHCGPPPPSFYVARPSNGDVVGREAFVFVEFPEPPYQKYEGTANGLPLIFHPIISSDGLFANVPVGAPGTVETIDIEITELATGAKGYHSVEVLAGPATRNPHRSDDAITVNLKHSAFEVAAEHVRQGTLDTIRQQFAAAKQVGDVIFRKNSLRSPVGTYHDAVGTLTRALHVPSAEVRITPNATSVAIEVALYNLNFAAHVAISSAPDCDIDVSMNWLRIVQGYDFVPNPSDDERFMVVPAPGSSPHLWISGEHAEASCTAGWLPWLEGWLEGTINDLLEDALESALLQEFTALDENGEPRLSAGINEALDDLTLPVNTPAVQTALGGPLDFGFSDITEGNGVTFAIDARVNTLGHCQRNPRLGTTYDPDLASPTFPFIQGGYSAGAAVTPGGFNQVLRAHTECKNLLEETLFNIDTPLGPLTTGTLSVLMPGFVPDDPTDLVRVELKPTMAPFTTENPGPAGEFAELRIPRLKASVYNDSNNRLLLVGMIGAVLGVDVALDSAARQVDFTVHEPPTEFVSFEVVDNFTGGVATSLPNIVPGVLAPAIPKLAGALGSVPLTPSFEFDGTTVNYEMVDIRRLDTGHIAAFVRASIPPWDYCNDFPQYCTNGEPDACKIFPDACDDGGNIDPCQIDPCVCNPHIPSCNIGF